jgi:NADPH2:quinone reductase
VAAVQIAVQAGAKVTGLVGSSEKFELVRSLGAENVLTYEEWEKLSDREAGSFDTVLDAAGGSSLKRAFRRAGPAGRVVYYGASNMVRGNTRSILGALRTLAQTPFFHPLQLMNANKGVFGINVLQAFDPDKRAVLVRSMEGVLKHFENGDFRVIVGKTFPLADAAAAHSYLQSRKATGKVILTCS